MSFATDFAAAQQAITEELIAATRTTARIAAQDLTFSRSSDPSIAAKLDQKSVRLLELTQKLLNRASLSRSIKSIRLPDIDSVDSQWRRIVDAVDGLYERADTCLDEFGGLIKKQALQSVLEESQSHDQNAPRKRSYNTYRDALVAKPQLQFEVKPPNFNTPPFKPILSCKPHAVVSLEASLHEVPEEDGTLQCEHPYGPEIRQYNWPSHALRRKAPIEFQPFESSSAIWVDTYEGVQEMLQSLKGEDVIAIDLEHHDAHSYLGIVSLMQISTREQDWILDTLKPWRHRLEVLNEVFADPKVVKVLHGAHMDTIWLQRDFGLYLVGLFDTHHVCRILGFPGGSLAFLLKTYINFDAQKQHQMADWRIRPLPQELLEYARSDTHFLIYIYDCLRNELLDQGESGGMQVEPLDDLLARSKDTALQRFEYPHSLDDISSSRNAWAGLLTRYPTEMSGEQVAVFAAIYNWRERLAREEDEGLHSIIPNHALFALAKAMPTTKGGIFSIVHPVSSFLRQDADGLVAAVALAKANGANGPDSKTVYEQYPSRRRHLARPALRELNPDLISLVSEAAGSISVKQGQRANVSSFWGQASVRTSSHSRYVGESDKALLDIVHAIPADATLALDEEAPVRRGRAMLDQSVASVKRKGKSVERPNRKRKALGGNENTEALGISARNDSAAVLAVQQRARRKAHKKARRESNANGTGAVATAGSFDYEAAGSVLDSKLPQQLTPLKKSINPYAKAESAPGGLKRAQEPRAGKSLTYK